MAQTTKRDGSLEVDERYSRFHQQGRSVVRWDYHGRRWLVVGHQEVCQAARAPETFSSRHDLPNDGSSPFEGVMIPPTPIRAVPIEHDALDHQTLRRLLAPRFSPGMVRTLTPQIADFVTWCLDRRIESGDADLFHDLAKLVPAMTTMHLLGLPVEDAEVIADAVHVRGEDRFALNRAWSLLLQRTVTTVAERRQEPRDDLISYLLEAEIDGQPLSDMELVQICFTFVIGGMATTARLTLGALSYFAAHPEDRARVLANPALMKSAVEEFLRYYSPVPFLSRTATQDTRLGEEEIKKGDRVALCFAAANRDPKVFDRPDEFVLDRAPNQHVALGHGVHFCIGAAIGRIEATTMVTEVLRRMPDFQPVGATRPPDDDETRASNWAQRLEGGLPVSFSPGEPLGALEGFALARAEPAAL